MWISWWGREPIYNTQNCFSCSIAEMQGSGERVSRSALLLCNFFYRLGCGDSSHANGSQMGWIDLLGQERELAQYAACGLGLFLAGMGQLF